MTAPRPPEGAIADLVPADVLAAASERHPLAPAVWRGVVWSRLGRGDLAWQCWDTAADAVVLAPWILAERGRVVRELGLHDEAERFDEDGLSRAGDSLDICMLRIGLAADAIGQGDVATAASRVETVRPLLAALPAGPRTSRQRLRLSWVRVELALVTGTRPPLDLLPARVDGKISMPDDYRHGTSFHRAKGLLFAGTARRDASLLAAARDLAPPVLAWAIELSRADLGEEGALVEARAAWGRIVPPPGYADAVARTPTARRLGALEGAQPRLTDRIKPRKRSGGERPG